VRSYTLVISCPDRVGIVAAVSGFIAERGGSITEADYHSDPETGWFFMRQKIAAQSLALAGIGEFEAGFTPLARDFAMSWKIADSARPQKAVIFVSKQDHCLADVLHRWRTGELACEIPCVISNHEDHRGFVEWHGIPFHHVPVAGGDKEAAFAEMEELCAACDADVLVLARYMQILPKTLCEKFNGRIINIHHGFLPSFAGEKPYHQARARGVKLMGATCHYVTEELDAGPIIEQDVIRIDHGDCVEDMIRLGRDVEKQVLSRGLRYHVEDRVIVCGNRTVVFR
jgi:formyltetrahydrofolate deformylase